jgi:6,7-dimethyl-8-ribityllumazine synthase
MADYKLIPIKDIWAIPTNLRIACLYTRRNETQVQQLLQKNIQFLKEQGFEDISVFEVPGSLELPSMAAKLMEDYDIILLFGIIIKGKTMHYEFISQAIFNGIVSLSIQYPSKTLISGILTVEDKNLLEERISDNFARSALNLWLEKIKI